MFSITGGEIILKNDEILLTEPASIESATESSITFLENDNALKLLYKTNHGTDPKEEIQPSGT